LPRAAIDFCFSRTLHILLQPCCPVASLEAMYLLYPSKTFTPNTLVGLQLSLVVISQSFGRSQPRHHFSSRGCWNIVVIQLLGGPKVSVGEVIVRLTDFALSCPRLCFSCTLLKLLRPCHPVASLEAMYLSKTFTLYHFDRLPFTPWIFICIHVDV
jgi:hypothetical protein